MTTQFFETIEELRKSLRNLPAPCAESRAAAEARNASLTKPAGALGRLEEIAIWYAGWRKNPRPYVESPQVIVFAGNHGIASQGISAFPVDVTQQMVANFEAGGAAVNQLAKLAGAHVDVCALSLDRPTADFTTAPALSEAEFLEAFNAGFAAVNPTADLLVVGEMGIGNTTCAAALAASNYGGGARDWVGRGTGVDDAGLSRKEAVVAAGLLLHGDHIHDGIDALRRLGGRELSAMAGAVMRARKLCIPVILDGFICTSAVACLETTAAGALDHCIAGHCSAEVAHQALLTKIDKEPLLSLGLRLGEASGAVLAIQIVRAALSCHSGMASFAEAGVAEG